MQEDRENTLIERLKTIAKTSRDETEKPTRNLQRAWPPVTEEEMVQVEARLGFRLPDLLRRIYLEVGNGGFGPAYGLLPLDKIPPDARGHQSSLVENYQGMRSFSQKHIEELWADDDVKPALWPEQVLILCDRGCNIYSCVACFSPDLMIFRMDSNENFLIEWAIEATSLYQWLDAWVAGILAEVNWEQATKVSVALLGGNA